jgi:DNA-binding XRE family transcriptional regulator
MEENRIDRAKRFARIWWSSRAKAGVSQEYMALGLGVSKKTIQNWEKGISSPTFFQATEWFHLLGLNPLPYYFEYVYPAQMSQDELAKGCDVSDEQINEALELVLAQIPMELKRGLLFLFHGAHGSSPYAVVQMLLAHLQSPMKDRVSNAASILQNYEMAQELGTIAQPKQIQPDLDCLQAAVQSGRYAAVSNQSGYSLNMHIRPSES